MSLSAWLDRLALDFRHSLRVLGKAPLFTAVAILSLALGIGANTAIFTIVHALLLKALPITEPDRLGQVIIGRERTSFTHPIWEAIRDRQQVFDGAFAFSTGRFDLGAGGEKQFIEGMSVSGDYFRTLGVRAVAGRTLTPDDDRRDGGTNGPVAVLSYAYWRDRYQSSPAVIGSTIRLDGHPFTIVGVIQPGFYGVNVGGRFDVAVPLATHAVTSGKDNMLDRRTSWWLRVMGRLRPGMSREQAQAGLRALLPAIREATMPPTYRTQKARDEYLKDSFTLVPAATGHSYLRNQYRIALLTLMGAVALVLLISCANLANLLLARASARQREFAVRLALGASRVRLVRQLLTESLLLAAGGAVIGLVFAQWASRLVVRQIFFARSPIFLDLSIDRSILGFTIAVAVLTAIIFGLAPAFRSTDLSANALLKGSSRSIASAGWRGFSLEKLLLVIQIAVSLVLVCGAALLVRSFASLATLDPGFDRRQVLVVSVDARRADYPVERRLAEYDRILEAVRGLPGVRSAAATVMTPISGSSWSQSVFVRGLESMSDRDREVYMNRVSPGYFATLGTPIYTGRDVSAQDTLTSPDVAIVNETFARRFFHGATPLGQTFEVHGGPGAPREPFQIVGLVKDSKYVDLRKDAPPTAYFAWAQDKNPNNYPTFLVRGADDPTSIARGVTAAVRDINPHLALELKVFDTLVNDSLAQERLIAMLSGFFGALALLVAGMGLYGMMSLIVSRRRNEIGIRMALGAQPSSVVWMVLRDVAIVTLIGVAIGAVSGVLSGRLVTTLLFGLEASDVTTWGLAIGALGAAAGLAGYLPARRAARLDPMLALREE